MWNVPFRKLWKGSGRICQGVLSMRKKEFLLNNGDIVFYRHLTVLLELIVSYSLYRLRSY